MLALSGFWAGLYSASLGTWLLLLVVVGLRIRRNEPLSERRAIQRAMPALDLAGTWLGALAALALLLGRSGYTVGWAVALGLVALMATVALYDRAVLVPSLRSAHKRLAINPKEWEPQYSFLWRMSACGRLLTLAMGAWALFYCCL